MNQDIYIVDSHCHLNYKELYGDVNAVIERATAADVRTLLAINTKLSEFDDVYEIAEANQNVFASVGVHPHEAENEPNVQIESLLIRAAKPKVIAIGETGLDYYYDHAPRELQKANFITHIQVARATKKPLIVHTRDAEEDTLEILKTEMGRGAFPAVIHCFTASQEFAKQALEMGFYISLSGILTFKNAKDLQEIAKWLPIERILVETDAPYLAPVPHRGKPCEPAYTANTAAFLANLRGLSLEEVATATTDNFFKLFSKAKRASK
jgi:TatD DNase family protein